MDAIHHQEKEEREKKKGYHCFNYNKLSSIPKEYTQTKKEIYVIHTKKHSAGSTTRSHTHACIHVYSVVYFHTDD